MRASLLALLLALPSAAHAQPARPHGVELAFRLGAGAFSDSSSTPFSNAPSSRFGTEHPGVGLQIDLGYRLHPRVALGVGVGLQRLGSGDVTGYFSRNGAVTLGVYGRYAIPLVPSFRHELWVRLGVDVYSSFSRSLTPMMSTDPSMMSTTTVMDVTRIDYSAVSLPLHVGIDFGITSHLSLGPVLGASLWIPYDRCTSGYDRNLGMPTSDCVVPGGLIPNVMLFAGLNIRLHP